MQKRKKRTSDIWRKKKQWHRLVSCLFINKSEGTLEEKYLCFLEVVSCYFPFFVARGENEFTSNLKLSFSDIKNVIFPSLSLFIFGCHVSVKIEIKSFRNYILTQKYWRSNKLKLCGKVLKNKNKKTLSGLEETYIIWKYSLQIGQEEKNGQHHRK